MEFNHLLASACSATPTDMGMTDLCFHTVSRTRCASVPDTGTAPSDFMFTDEQLPSIRPQRMFPNCAGEDSNLTWPASQPRVCSRPKRYHIVPHRYQALHISVYSISATAHAVFPAVTVYFFVLYRATLHCHYVALPLVTEMGGNRMC